MHALLVQHSVADFDQWKAGFDAHEEARRAMGVTMTNVHRVNGDPNEVVVFVGVKDVATALEAFGSDDMQEAMKAAGVTSKPSIEILENRGMDLPASGSNAGLLFKHAVEDYDKFRTVFDAHDEMRRSHAAADGWSVNTHRDDGNFVVGYVRTTDLDQLRAFTQDENLAQAMSEAGVSGPPTFIFLDHVEMKKYA